MKLLFLIFTLVLTIFAKTCHAYEILIQDTDKFICASSDLSEQEKQSINCKTDISKINFIGNLFCSRDAEDKLCGNNGCISAEFKLARLSIDYNITFVKYIVTNEMIEESKKKVANYKLSVMNTMNETIKNVSLSENEEKTALLKISSVSYFYTYKVCVDPFSGISGLSDEDQRELQMLAENFCCTVEFEEPIDKILTFNLEIIIIAFLLIFYVVIVVMAWKCKDEHVDHHGKSFVKPISIISRDEPNHENVSPKRTQIQIRHVDDDKQHIEVVVENPIETRKKSIRPTVMFDDQIDEDEEEVRRYSLNKRRPTGFASSLKSGLPKDIKKIQEEVQKNLRRKSVQFNQNLVDVRKMSSRAIVDSEDEQPKYTTYTQDEEHMKQKELHIRRKSMLLGPEFFKDVPKKKIKAPTTNDTMDDMEEVAIRALANKARRASAAYAVQKAKSLNVSDDSDY